VRGEGKPILVPAGADLYRDIRWPGETEQDRPLTGVNAVKNAIIDLLGLNKDQFKQISMIAQGEFWKLLNDKQENREGILQTVFMTAGYGAMAARIEEQASQTRTEVDRYGHALKLRAEEIRCLEDSEHELKLKELKETEEKLMADQAGNLQTLLEQILEEEAACETQLGEEERKARELADQRMMALKSGRDRNAQLDRYEQALKDRQRLDDRQEEMSERRAQYDRQYLASVVLQPDYEKYTRARREQAEAAEQAAALKKAHEADAAAALQTKEAAQQVPALREQARQRQEQADHVRAGEELFGRRDKTIREHETCRKQCAQAEAKQRQLSADQTAAQEAAARYAQREQELQDIPRQLSEAAHRQQQIADWLRQARQCAGSKEGSANYDYEQKKLDLKKKQELYEAALAAYKKARQESDQAEELLDRNRAGLLARGLEDGQACPVCGATQHPHLAQAPPDQITEEHVQELSRATEKARGSYDRSRDEVTAANSTCRQALLALNREMSRLIEAAEHETAADDEGISEQANDDRRREPEKQEAATDGESTDVGSHVGSGEAVTENRNEGEPEEQYLQLGGRLAELFRDLREQYQTGRTEVERLQGQESQLQEAKRLREDKQKELQKLHDDAEKLQPQLDQLRSQVTRTETQIRELDRQIEESFSWMKDESALRPGNADEARILREQLQQQSDDCRDEADRREKADQDAATRAAASGSAAETAAKQLRRREQELAEQTRSWEEIRTRHGFEDDPAYKACLRTREQLREEEAQLSEYDSQRKEIEVTLRECERTIRIMMREEDEGKVETPGSGTETGNFDIAGNDVAAGQDAGTDTNKDISGEDIRLLRADLGRLQELLDESRHVQQKASDALNAAVSQRQRNQAILDEIITVRRQLGPLEESSARLTTLSKLLRGTLAGASRLSLETYVQTSGFESIVAAANIRFYQMSGGRYEMRRHDSKGEKSGKTDLSLDVLDHYTNRTRPAGSLSGGESFQASLSLALGLADQVTAAAGGIRADTLFIDEGFGTLDEASLEQAARTLWDLAGEHRLVCIISHRTELMERFPQQLVIERTQTGSHVRTVMQDV